MLWSVVEVVKQKEIYDGIWDQCFMIQKGNLLTASLLYHFLSCPPIILFCEESMTNTNRYYLPILI